MGQPAYGQDLEAVMSTRLAQAGSLRAEIGQLRGAWRVERHPLVQRWLADELTATDLQSFAAEHYHVLLALQRAARRAAALSDGLLADQLRRYAADQDELIGLWCRFAVATGWGGGSWYFGEDPLPQTAACARALSGKGASLDLHLVSIYAIESALAEIAPLQLEALTTRYGFDERSTAYFRVSGERSATAALTAEAGLTSLLPYASLAALVAQAELAYRSYLELLDGVMRAALVTV